MSMSMKQLGYAALDAGCNDYVASGIPDKCASDDCKKTHLYTTCCVEYTYCTPWYAQTWFFIAAGAAGAVLLLIVVGAVVAIICITKKKKPTPDTMKKDSQMNPKTSQMNPKSTQINPKSSNMMQKV
uniref:Uncharacterized protein n=1 Tax=Caenorhabditis japonica TaxID=281687 RepID=A0A8R1DVP5_CAEJA